MMYCKATIDGQEYFLEQQSNGTWVRKLSAPLNVGTYDVTITAATDNGNVIILNSSDAVWGELLKLIVRGKSLTAARLMKYLPRYWHTSEEMREILESHGVELDILLDEIQSIHADGFILTSSAERISQWEKKLQIIPNGNITQRRLFVLSKLRGVGKLNETRIKAIVSAFTGGDSIVALEDSNILVRVLPPNNGEIFLFPDIEKSIKTQKPAHLGLIVERYYSTWQNIRDDFSSWEDLKQSKTSWNDVRNHIVK